jgi:hypothetical protein
VHQERLTDTQERQISIKHDVIGWKSN